MVKIIRLYYVQLIICLITSTSRYMDTGTLPIDTGTLPIDTGTLPIEILLSPSDLYITIL